MKILVVSVEKKNVIMIKKNALMETDCWKCDKKILNIDVLKW